MVYFFYFLKGIVIGIANAIPGVSGGTMAVTMGIYDQIISAVTHFFTKFKENLKLLLPIIIGAGVGIIGLSFAIEFCFERFPLQTNFLFIGLIIGGLPMMCKKVKGKKFRAGHLLCLIVFFLLIIGFALLNGTEGGNAAITTDFVGMLKLFGVGIIAAATMVIPGVSGSMILILMGYYYPIIETINTFIKGVFSLDFPVIFHGAGILIPAGIGVIIGIVLLAKLIELAFQKFPEHTNWSIIGLIAASPIAILITANLPAAAFSFVSVSTGILALALGFIAAKFLGEK